MSEQRKIAEAIRLSEEKFSLAFANNPAAVCLTKEDGTFLDVNSTWEELNGYTHEEIIGNSASKLPIWPDQETRGRFVRELKKNGKVHWEAQEFLKRSGEIYIAELSAQLLTFNDEKLILSTLVDITERSRAEEKLRQSEERLRNLIRLAPAGIYEMDFFANHLINVNDVVSEWLGYSREELMAMNPLDLTDEAGRAQFQERVRRKLAGEEVKPTSEMKLYAKDGHEVYVILNVGNFNFVDGKPSSVLVIVHNITERKLAEQALAKSNATLTEVLNSIQDDFYVLDREWKFVYASRSFTSKAGKEPKDLIGKNIWELFPRHLGTILEENFRASMEKGEVRRFEVSGKYTDASYSMTSFPSAEGITVLGMDISARKRAEEATAQARREAEQRLAELTAIMESVPVGLMITRDREGQHIVGNRAAHDILHVPYQEENISKSVPDLDQIRSFRVFQNGVEIPADQLPVQRAARGEVIRDWECDIFYKDGSTRHLLINAEPLYDDQGQPRGAVAGFVDLSERIRAEAALQLSEERFRLALRNAPVSVAAQDCNLVFQWAYNKRSKREEEIVGKTDFDLFPKEEAERLVALKRSVLKTGQEVREKLWLTTAGEKLFTDLLLEPLKDAAGNISGIGIAMIDLTPIKLAEEEIHSREEYFRSMLDGMLEGCQVIGYDWIYTYVNNAAERHNRRPKEELIGKDYRLAWPGIEKTSIFRKMVECMETRQPQVFENEFIYPDGLVRWFEISLHPMPQGVFMLSVDITERRHADELLRQSESRYRSLVEVSPNAILMHRGGKIEMANPAALELFGASSPNQLIGKTLYDLYHPKVHEQIRRRINRLLSEGGTVSVAEEPIIRLNGEVREAEVMGAAYTDAQGPAIQVVIRDISERKRQENELHRLNRTLNALGHINKAMVHSADEEAYMDEVCQIIVKDCGHAMVWIGFADNDEAKTVRPVASAGFEEGYLQTLNITWADTERGRGPTGTAIRTGQVSLCRDMLNDPRFKPWRAEAVRRGYASSIVLPLMARGAAFGSITIYSRIVDGFSDSEIELLKELAEDLAYGITMLRTRQAHDKAEGALRESEARFRQLADASFEGLVVHDGGLLMDVNERIPEMVGYTAAELVGQQMWQFIDEKYHQLVSEKMRAGSTELYEIELVHKDGRRVPVEVVGRPMVWRDQQVRVAALRDITERKKAEEIIRANQERFRSVLDGSIDVIYRLNMQTGEFEYISPSCEIVTGYTPEEYTTMDHKSAEEMIHPEDRIAMAEGILEAMRVGSKDLEYRQVTKTGEYRWLSNHIAIVFDEDGLPLYRDGNIRDITERKLAEAALKASEEQYHTLFNTLIEGFCIIEVIFDEKNNPVDYRFLEVNPAFEAQTGLKDASGKSMRSLAPDHEEFWFQTYGHIALTGESARFENEARALGHWYEVFAYKVGGPESRKVAILFSDILERKKAETETRRLLDAIQAEKDRLSALVNSISDEVWFADMNKKFTLANPTALETFGVDVSDPLDIEQFAGNLEVFRPDGSKRPTSESPTLWALEGQVVRNMEEIIRIPASGELRHREVNASPVRDTQGNIIGAVAVVRDITSRKRAEQDLKTTNEELRRFNNVMSGRELRMVELKKEINSLCIQLGQPPRYSLDFEREAS